jgi:hypothetical protein
MKDRNWTRSGNGYKKREILVGSGTDSISARFSPETWIELDAPDEVVAPLTKGEVMAAVDRQVSKWRQRVIAVFEDDTMPSRTAYTVLADQAKMIGEWLARMQS